MDKLICNTCGHVIQNIEDGFVEWISKEYKEFNFRIIHTYDGSPLKNKCHKAGYDISDLPLEDFIGHK